MDDVLFLISDATLASEDLAIDLPVLKRLETDSCTLLERNRAQQDGVGCRTISISMEYKSRESMVRLMISGMQRVNSSDLVSNN